MCVWVFVMFVRVVCSGVLRYRLSEVLDVSLILIMVVLIKELLLLSMFDDVLVECIIFNSFWNMVILGISGMMVVVVMVMDGICRLWVISMLMKFVSSVLIVFVVVGCRFMVIVDEYFVRVMVLSSVLIRMIWSLVLLNMVMVIVMMIVFVNWFRSGLNRVGLLGRFIVNLSMLFSFSFMRMLIMILSVCIVRLRICLLVVRVNLLIVFCVVLMMVSLVSMSMIFEVMMIDGWMLMNGLIFVVLSVEMMIVMIVVMNLLVIWLKNSGICSWVRLVCVRVVYSVVMKVRLMMMGVVLSMMFMLIVSSVWVMIMMGCW